MPYFGPDFRPQQINTKPNHHMTSCLTASLCISCCCFPFQSISSHGFKPLEDPLGRPLDPLTLQVKPTQALSTVRVLAASRARAETCVHDACHIHCCNHHLRQQAHLDHSFSGAEPSQRWAMPSNMCTGDGSDDGLNTRRHRRLCDVHAIPDL